ncbi:MAG: hypothetical protein CL678_10880 [Bdellovibrionaceae bacterium]|nr:hypothetical protein [Pseudobdellovibrionaceae bacterium]|tara:strand:+ start:3115 stop:3708 length:594 start_codon:yes stop_codon:yes gene_type:complete
MNLFYLIRHGETFWNEAGKFQGHADIELNENGKNQAKKLQEVVLKLSPDRVLSSDLKRAYETAKISTEFLNLKIQCDKRFREAHIGEAQGLTYSQLIDSFGKDLMNQWRSNSRKHLDCRYPQGESGAEMIKRILEGLTFFNSDPVDKTLIFTHGGVIRRVMQHLSDHSFERIPIPNGIVYPIQFKNEHWNILPLIHF